MPITLIAIGSFAVYEDEDGVVTSHDEDFGTFVYASDSGKVFGQFRMLMSDVDLGEATTEEVQSSIEADGPKTVTLSLS